MKKKLHIVGTKGIPARYGGFETFAERLALYLVGRDWDVSVYCEAPEASAIKRREWRGVDLVEVPISGQGPLSTIVYDYRCTKFAASQGGVTLTLGYGTSIFNVFHMLKRTPNIVNMDGIEWRRDKWSLLAKVWLYLNERFALWTATHLIADHPEIERYLVRKAHRPLTMIPYGADTVEGEARELPWGLEPDRYALVIARAEPENSILDIVEGYSCRQRGMPLIVLGNYDPDRNPFHRAVVNAASAEVRFVGAIYEASTVSQLRQKAALYVHGHRVGGTNPSLVEAMGAGCPILAHNNAFNRWVVGDGAIFFKDAAECDERLHELLDNKARRTGLSVASFQRFMQSFRWETILHQYEQLLERYLIDG